MNKKIICLIVAFSLFCSLKVFGSDVSNNVGISVSLNGAIINIKDLVIRNSRALVRYDSGIFERLGYKTYYDPINHEVVIKNDKDIVTVYLNDYVIYKNGLTSYTADIRCDIIEGQVYIPLRGFLESLNYSVRWDNGNKKISVDG